MPGLPISRRLIFVVEISRGQSGMLVDLVFDRCSRLRSGRTWQRSFAKTLTWRLFATVDTFIISALVTGNLRWAGSIVGVEVVSKMTLYYLHERAWGRASWGVEQPSGGAD
jgi:uncharacterized membrane protein